MVLAAEVVFRVWIVYGVIAKRHKKYVLKNVYYEIVYNNKCLLKLPYITVRYITVRYKITVYNCLI